MYHDENGILKFPFSNGILIFNYGSMFCFCLWLFIVKGDVRGLRIFFAVILLSIPILFIMKKKPTEGR